MRYRRPQAPKVHRESWQTIYMDLMTIVMVFFVILWSINQGKDVGVSETVGDVTAQMINLPGDVLFPAGKSRLSQEGRDVFKSLFDDPKQEVLSFQSTGLTKRLLTIHGHTDSLGKKEDNFQLGFNRAYTAYREIRKYSKELPDHVVICTHSDNTPAQEVPQFQGKISPIQRAAIKEARAKNRRITIEDKMVNVFESEE